MKNGASLNDLHYFRTLFWLRHISACLFNHQPSGSDRNPLHFLAADRRLEISVQHSVSFSGFETHSDLLHLQMAAWTGFQQHDF